MSKIIYRLSFLVFIIMLLCAFSLSTVSASWTYYTSPKDCFSAVGPTISKWESLNSIPNNEEGKKIENLVNNVVSPDSPQGLNGGPNSFLNDAIQKQENNGKYEYGSPDFHSGADAKTQLGLDGTNVEFVIHSPKDNPNLKYMFVVNMDFGKAGNLFQAAKPNVPFGEKVYIVYRTTMKLNASTQKWENICTESGYAISDYYQNRLAGSTFVKTPSIRVDSWVKAKLGLEKDVLKGNTLNQDNAIYIFKGQNTIAYLDNANDKLYFKIIQSASTQLTLSINNNLSASARILTNNNSSIQVIASSTVSGNVNKVTWQANKNVCYFAELTGSTEIDITLS